MLDKFMDGFTLIFTMLWLLANTPGVHAAMVRANFLRK